MRSPRLFIYLDQTGLQNGNSLLTQLRANRKYLPYNGKQIQLN